jgi:hypothetical protein
MAESTNLIAERKKDAKSHNELERASVQVYSTSLEAMTKGKAAAANQTRQARELAYRDDLKQ